jgi:L-2-hydroxyglutarate oxidase
MIDGSVHAGPNAVPAFAREGYRWRDVDVRDAAEILTNPGVWRLGRKYWRTGAAEIVRSVSKRRFTAALQRLVPAIRTEDLHPSPAGVRAQALGRDGNLLDDFVWNERGRVVNVINAPSPAATASLALGSEIADRLLARQPS